MRILIDELHRVDEVGPPQGSGARQPDLADLPTLYAYPEAADTRWWARANMVSTLDGAATGSDGLSGTISDALDKEVFGLLRALADVVVVGAGTVEREGYRAPRPPAQVWSALRDGRPQAPALAVVSRRGRVPDSLLAEPRDGDGDVLLVTCGSAGRTALDLAAERLGPDNVLVLGDSSVDLVAMTDAFAARGWTRGLCEGGPTFLATMVTDGRIDELCLTVSPKFVAGDHPRIAHGLGIDRTTVPRLLVEHDGALLGRWAIEATDPPA
ncbi:pyrimidine reductase family protein [Mumia zhuanghuii]|uniref:Dihydrofolate reductase family protein n=2 Tax=Mumia TaxID=1546255 RepID=A0ABW1QI10_9ACTN|nr:MULTISPECIES: dihydrofolate reductase family protein [Mumia]KAA1418314.1 pyrimidine reductase family protein [Mumia zhuanghuii]